LIHNADTWSPETKLKAAVYKFAVAKKVIHGKNKKKRILMKVLKKLSVNIENVGGSKSPFSTIPQYQVVPNIYFHFM